MNNEGMFYTNVSDYETKEDMMNDFIALRMYDMAKDKEIERLNNIINELEKICETRLNIFEQMTDEQREEQLDKYKLYDTFLSKIQELKGDSSNDR